MFAFLLVWPLVVPRVRKCTTVYLEIGSVFCPKLVSYLGPYNRASGDSGLPGQYWDDRQCCGAETISFGSGFHKTSAPAPLIGK
jgi:hypothetical protein